MEMNDLQLDMGAVRRTTARLSTKAKSKRASLSFYNSNRPLPRHLGRFFYETTGTCAKIIYRELRPGESNQSTQTAEMMRGTRRVWPMPVWATCKCRPIWPVSTAGSELKHQRADKVAGRARALGRAPPPCKAQPKYMESGEGGGVDGGYFGWGWSGQHEPTATARTRYSGTKHETKNIS